MAIDQDKLDIALEKKQNSMLDIKQGFYSPSEGEDGDTGGCIHNGVFYYAIKVNNQWQFISMQDAGKLDSAQSKRKFDIDNVIKDNIAKYLAPYLLQINQDLLEALIGKENRAVHHSFSANFDNTQQINYLQYGTGDVNETNDSSGRFFVVPFGCKLKNINFDFFFFFFFFLFLSLISCFIFSIFSFSIPRFHCLQPLNIKAL